MLAVHTFICNSAWHTFIYSTRFSAFQLYLVYAVALCAATGRCLLLMQSWREYAAWECFESHGVNVQQVCGHQRALRQSKALDIPSLSYPKHTHTHRERDTTQTQTDTHTYTHTHRERERERETTHTHTHTHTHARSAAIYLPSVLLTSCLVSWFYCVSADALVLSTNVYAAGMTSTKYALTRFLSAVGVRKTGWEWNISDLPSPGDPHRPRCSWCCSGSRVLCVYVWTVTKSGRRCPFLRGGVLLM